jgi:hypothetical protein
MYRILAPSGTLFISVPLFDAEHSAPHDYWRFTGYGLRLLLHEAGFEVESITRRGGYFWVLNKQFRSVHEYLFPPLRRRWVKALRYPLKIFSVIVFELFTPIVLYNLDRLDTSRHYTVGYLGIARKTDIADVRIRSAGDSSRTRQEARLGRSEPRLTAVPA